MSDMGEYFNEMQRKYKEAAERKEMEGEKNAHELSNLVNGLGPDGLEVLTRVCHTIGNAKEKATEYAFYYAGIAEGLRSVKHGYCLGCGLHHDEEFSKLIAPEES